MNVEQLMTTPVQTCCDTDMLNRAAQIMWEGDCGAVPVVDSNKRPIGMITDRDICMASYTQGKPLFQIAVSNAMSRTIIICRKDESVTTAESMMRSHQIRRLPIVGDDGTIVGILSLNDIATRGHLKRKIGVMHDALGAEAIATTLSAICTRPLHASAAE